MSNATPISQPLLPHGAQPGYNMLSTAPGPLVRAGDFLRLNATTTDTIGELTLNGRLLTLDGEIVPFRLALTFSGTGNQTSVATPLTHGWIIGFDVFVSSGTITDGEVQASVEVVQGTGTPATRVMCLASGEVTNTRGLGLGAFLSQACGGFLAGAGMYGENPANPAAGTNYVFTVPAGTHVELIDISCLFTAAVAVGNRQVFLRFAAFDGLFSTYWLQTLITASQVFDIAFYRDRPVHYTVGTIINSSFPAGIRLGPTDTITLGCLSMAAADTITSVQINYARR